MPKLQVDGVTIAEIEVIPAETLRRQLADAATSMVNRVGIELRPSFEGAVKSSEDLSSDTEFDWESGTATIEVRWSKKRSRE